MCLTKTVISVSQRVFGVFSQWEAVSEMGTDSLDRAFARLISRQPRFAPEVGGVSPNDVHSRPDEGDLSSNENRHPSSQTSEQKSAGATWTLSDLVDPSVMSCNIAATQRQFQLESEKDAAHLWLYSFCNTLVAPSLWLMVQESLCPSPNIDDGILQHREGMWWSFHPGAMTTCDQFGAIFADTIRPVIESLSEVTSASPAPLRAIAVDALGSAATEAGNDDFAPEEGEECAATCEHAFCEEAASWGARVPPFRSQWITDAMGEERVVVVRSSCCMMYRSPMAEMCTNCPRRDKESRRNLLEL